MKTVLIDLDGTLLHMDQEGFIKTYFGSVAKKFSKNYDSERVMAGLTLGTKAMVANDGTLSNADVFWKVFERESGYEKDEVYGMFEDFYANEFDACKASTSPSVYSKMLVEALTKKGYQVKVATNPMFPKIATNKRIKWAGLDSSMFKEITTYEDYHYCKPNINYYKEIIEKFNLNPEECYMIGNDVDEDLVARKIGLKVCLVNDNLINRNNSDIDAVFVGSLKELVEAIEKEA